jgi:hypothetical protein
MKKSRASLLIPIIGGVLLIAVGAILLLNNLGIIGLPWEVVVGPLFGIGGIIFLMVFILNNKEWWALIPGFVLIAIGTIIFMNQNLGGFADQWGGLIFLGFLGLAFLLIYIIHPQNWWGIIPGGVLITLAVVSVIPETESQLVGGGFFLGMALTFGLVYILPKPAGKLRWALYPAAILLVLSIAAFLGVERLANFVGPVVLLVIGGFFVYRALRRGK